MTKIPTIKPQHKKEKTKWSPSLLFLLILVQSSSSIEFEDPSLDNNGVTTTIKSEDLEYSHQNEPGKTGSSLVNLDNGTSLVTLYKCGGLSDTVVQQKFVEIPTNLRIPLFSSGENKIFTNVYNFTLENSQNSNQCQNGSFVVRLAFGADKDKVDLKLIAKNINPDKPHTPDLKANHHAPGEELLERLTEKKNYFTAKGFFKNNRDYFHPRSFCIDKLTTKEMGIKVSKAECIKDKPCIPKCCPMGMKVRMDVPGIFECASSAKTMEDWEPIFETGGSAAEDSVGKIEPNYWHTQISCDAPNDCVAIVQPSVFFSGQVTFPNWPATIQILPTGQVTIQFPGMAKPKFIDLAKIGTPSNKYCVDGLVSMAPKNEDEDGTAGGLDREEDIVLIFRRSKNNSVAGGWINVLTLFLGAIFLLITVIGFGLIWDRQNVQGWTVTTFAFCHFASFLILAIGYGATLWFPSSALRTIPCILNGVLMQFMFIATFSWLAVLNFDLWSSIRHLNSSERRLSGKRRFLCHSLFGFGLPLLILTISVTLETQVGIRNTSIVRPQYGQFNCFLGPLGLIAHAIIPVILLLAVNVILAFLILTIFWRIRRTNKESTAGDSNASQNTKFAKIQTKMAMQVLVIMLISVGFIIGGWFSYGGNGTWTKWIGWAGSLYNVLQAILLQWIFLWRKPIRMQLAERYDWFATILDRLEMVSTKFSCRIKSKSKQLDEIKPTNKMMTTTMSNLTRSSSSSVSEPQI